MTELSPLAWVVVFLLIYMALWVMWICLGLAFGLGEWCGRIISRWLDRRERRQWK